MLRRACRASQLFYSVIDPLAGDKAVSCERRSNVQRATSTEDENQSPRGMKFPANQIYLVCPFCLLFLIPLFESLFILFRSNLTLPVREERKEIVTTIFEEKKNTTIWYKESREMTYQCMLSCYFVIDELLLNYVRSRTAHTQRSSHLSWNLYLPLRKCLPSSFLAYIDLDSIAAYNLSIPLLDACRLINYKYAEKIERERARKGFFFSS